MAEINVDYICSENSYIMKVNKTHRHNFFIPLTTVGRTCCSFHSLLSPVISTLTSFILMSSLTQSIHLFLGCPSTFILNTLFDTCDFHTFAHPPHNKKRKKMSTKLRSRIQFVLYKDITSMFYFVLGGNHLVNTSLFSF
jgi:hypothetical protein